MLGHLVDAFLLLLTVKGFLFCLLGVVLGTVVGVIPGLSGAMLIALCLPLTLYMDSTLAMILLVALYVGSVSGGLVSAVLLRIPGNPASVVTTFDGYPIAVNGRPRRALALGNSASLIGGVISWLFLLFLAPQLARWSINFGPWEFFALMLMALVLMAAVSEGAFLMGLLSGFFGILVSLPGQDLASGVERLTFGIPEMAAGFHILPVLLGMFALGQTLSDATARRDEIDRMAMGGFTAWLPIADWSRHCVNMVRSSLIGTFIGILPGIGASVASIIAYTTARNVSKEPEMFGKGSEEGLVACESANNASVGGALVPLVAMGLPGSVIDAILLSALIMHGFSPGPLLYVTQPGLVYAIVASCLFATVLMYLFMSSFAGVLARVIDIPRYLLLPAIMVMCIYGAYATGNKMFDVWVMFGFGIVGFVMIRCKIPAGPFIIGFVLAPLAEFHLRAGLQTSGGSILPLLSRPMAMIFLLATVMLLLWPFVRNWREERRSTNAEKEADA